MHNALCQPVSPRSQLFGEWQGKVGTHSVIGMASCQVVAWWGGDAPYSVEFGTFITVIMLFVPAALFMHLQHRMHGIVQTDT